MIIKILSFAVLIVSVLGEKVRYDNYALYKVHASNEYDVRFLRNLEADNDNLQFWKQPFDGGDYASVVAPPEKREEFEHNLRKRDIHSELMLENIQEAFDAQILSRRKRSVKGQLFWTNFQTVEDIYDWFDAVVANNSNIVTQVTVGQTIEGRNITGLRVTRGSSRRVFVLQAGEIGADWLSPTVVTYIADRLIHSDDPEIRSIAEDFTWYIFPILNIDGHEFSQDVTRLWTKNRREVSIPTGTGVGVDLTKNWNSQWAVSGGSFNPNANNYIGLGPFSEPETRGISNYIINYIGANITGYLNFRSFGQRILIPFAHTDDEMYNYQEMRTILRRAVGSLTVRYNTQYLVGNSRAVYDGATGNVIDWIKYRFNPPIAATVLLRDTGARGYTLPVQQVLPSCEETYDFFLALFREARFINVI